MVSNKESLIFYHSHSVMLTMMINKKGKDTEIESSFPLTRTTPPVFFFHKAGTFFGPDLAAEERSLAASLEYLIFRGSLNGTFWGDSNRQQIYG